VGGLHPQQVVGLIHKHACRCLDPKQANGMAHHALEDLIEVEAGGDVAADVDEGTEFLFLAQQVMVQRVVVQGVSRQMGESFDAGLSLGLRPCLRQITQRQESQDIAACQQGNSEADRAIRRHRMSGGPRRTQTYHFSFANRVRPRWRVGRNYRVIGDVVSLANMAQKRAAVGPEQEHLPPARARQP
jgi:hypothetical protein